MKKIVLLLSILSLTASAFSQSRVTSNSTGEMTDEDFKNVAVEAKKIVKNFQRNIGYLAGNEYSHNEKVDIRGRALNKFMGEGERYPLAVPTRYGYDTMWHNAVVMGSAPSKYNKNQRKYELMKTYLSRLITQSEDRNYKYKKIVIEGADIVTLDNFKKVGEGSYIAAAHILQKYTGYYSADMVRAAYQDYTAKTITIFINYIKDEQDDGSFKYYWEIKLGDVDCDDIW